MVSCPKCDQLIDVEEDELDEGDPITCEECGATLLVTGTHPVELASEGGDDDEDEDEDEYHDEDDEDESEEEEEEEW